MYEEGGSMRNWSKTILQALFLMKNGCLRVFSRVEPFWTQVKLPDADIIVIQGSLVWWPRESLHSYVSPPVHPSPQRVANSTQHVTHCAQCIIHSTQHTTHVTTVHHSQHITHSTSPTVHRPQYVAHSTSPIVRRPQYVAHSTSPTRTSY